MVKIAVSLYRCQALACSPLFALGVAACQNSYYGGITREPVYSPAEFQYAAGGKPLHTAIHGNPFGLPSEQVAAAILAAMQAAGSSFDTALVRPPHFTLAVGARPNYAVRVVLNPADSLQADQICSPEGEIEEDGTARSEARVRMAFCRGPYLLSTSYGRIRGVGDPADPRFQRLIHDLTRELFPHREYRGGDASFLGHTR